MTPEQENAIRAARQRMAIAAARQRIAQRQAAPAGAPAGVAANMDELELLALAAAARRAREGRGQGQAAPAVQPSGQQAALQRPGLGMDAALDFVRSAAGGDGTPARTAAEIVGQQPEFEPVGDYGLRPADQRPTRDRVRDDFSPSRLQAALHTGAQGISFGSSDELIGAAGAVRSLFDSDRTMREGYEEYRDAARGAIDASRRDYPWTSLGAEVGGAVAVPMGAASRFVAGGPGWITRATGGTGLFGRAVRSAGVGGGLGAVYGFNAGEGENRVQSMGDGARLGGIAGGALPVAISGIGAAGRAVSSPVANVVERVLNRGSPARAARAIAGTARAAGMSADGVEQALRMAQVDGQDVFTVADAIGRPAQRQLSGIARSGGDAGEEIAQFLRQRQVDQPERLGGFVSDAFDGGLTARQLEGRLAEARRTAADVAYGEARRIAAPVDIRGALGVIDDVVGPMRNSGVAGDGADAALSRFRNRLAASDPSPDISRELSDFGRVLGVKQDVQDAAQAAWRAGRSNEAAALDRLWRSLDEALEAASPPYRQANDGYREASRVLESVQRGQEMRRPGVRAADTADDFAAMTPDQQDAARVGFGDRLAARIESSAGEGTNRARPLSATQIREQIRTIARDPERLIRQVDRENTMHETMSRSLQGSRTADNLQDIAGAAADDGVIRALLSGRPIVALQQGLGSVVDAFTQGSPQTRELIARALLSQDPTLLRQGMERVGMSEARRAVVEQLLRQGATSGAVQVQQP